MIYFTADLHLNHHNIIRYCNRPFADIAEMNSALVNNWNTTVNKSDTVYFLGDLFFKSNNFQLNGQIIYIKGNHDHFCCDYFMHRTINDLNILMKHRPPFNNQFISTSTELILCGHVHDKWKMQTYQYKDHKIPIINVGVDVWDYKPVAINDIMKLITCI